MVVLDGRMWVRRRNAREHVNLMLSALLLGGLVAAPIATLALFLPGLSRTRRHDEWWRLTGRTLVSLIWTAAWGAYWNCVLVMIYHDLRAAKEGINTQQIAAIFD